MEKSSSIADLEVENTVTHFLDVTNQQFNSFIKVFARFFNSRTDCYLKINLLSQQTTLNLLQALEM
jgi:hypothetical protein